MKSALASTHKPFELSAQRISTNTKLTPADFGAGMSVVKDTPSETHAKLVKQSQNWVAQTFFATLLKQMRDSPFKSELFSGGQGGKSFASLYDQELSQRMARGSGTKLVNSIVKRIEANAAYRRSISSPAKSENPTPERGSPQPGTPSKKGPVTRVSTTR